MPEPFQKVKIKVQEFRWEGKTYKRGNVIAVPKSCVPMYVNLGTFEVYVEPKTPPKPAPKK